MKCEPSREEMPLHKNDAGGQMGWFSNLKDALQKYADAHRKLPAYNDAQRHARDSAIAVGEGRYGDAISHLKELEKHLGNREDWVKFAHDGLSEEHKVPRGLVEPNKEIPYDSNNGL